MKKTFKQKLALIAVIAWGVLIIFTLICAFLDTPWASQALTGLIITDIALPVVIFAIQLVTRNLRRKNTRNDD